MSDVVVRDDGIRTWSERPATVVDAILRAADAHPGKEALRDTEGALTYCEFVELAAKVAANLVADAGVQPGDRIGLLLSNSSRFVVAAVGALMCRAVVVPLNTKLRANELDYEIADARPRVLIADAEWWEGVEALPSVRAVPSIYVAGERTKHHAYNDLLKGSGLRQARLPAENDPAFICYTSGTTGSPRGAVIKHVNCVNNFVSFAKVANLGPSERTLVMVPMFHVTGLLAQLFLVLSVGGSCVIMPRFEAREALEAIQRERITHMIGAPTVYLKMLLDPQRLDYDVGSVRRLISGGAPISPESVLALTEWMAGAEFQNAYGMTESASVTTVVPLGEAIRKIKTIGLPVPVTQCKTVDLDGKECEPGEPGELCFSGPQVSGAYWNNADATSRTFRGEWLHTGDIAAIDTEGYVELLDRIKDMINRGGEKVYCVEVEAALHEYEGIADAAVVGVPDALYGEAVKAVVVMRPDVDVDVGELRAFLAGRLASYKVPTLFDIVDELPRNTNGKVVKSSLR